MRGYIQNYPPKKPGPDDFYGQVFIKPSKNKSDSRVIQTIFSVQDKKENTQLICLSQHNIGTRKTQEKTTKVHKKVNKRIPTRKNIILPFSPHLYCMDMHENRKNDWQWWSPPERSLGCLNMYVIEGEGWSFICIVWNDFNNKKVLMFLNNKTKTKEEKKKNSCLTPQGEIVNI